MAKASAEHSDEVAACPAFRSGSGSGGDGWRSCCRMSSRIEDASGHAKESAAASAVVDSRRADFAAYVRHLASVRELGVRPPRRSTGLPKAWWQRSSEPPLDCVQHHGGKRVAPT